MDLIYIILLLIALIFICMGKHKTSKALLFITLVSYVTLLIEHSAPIVVAYSVTMKNGLLYLWDSIKDLLIPYCARLIPLSLSLFFVKGRKRNMSIIFILLTIIVIVLSHWNTIVSIAYSGVR